MRRSRIFIAARVIVVILGTTLGCVKEIDKQQEASEPSNLVAQFLKHLKPKVPTGWKLHKPSCGTIRPWGWEKGKGNYILIYHEAAPVTVGKRAPWTDVHIWVMDEGYSARVPIKTGQGPAQEIAAWHRRRVFVAGGSQSWPKNQVAILAALKADGAEAVEQAPFVSIDITRSGTYEDGRWKYVYVYTKPASLPRGACQLYYDGKELLPPSEKDRLGDYYVTPWGKLWAVPVNKGHGGGIRFMPWWRGDTEGDQLHPPGEEATH